MRKKAEPDPERLVSLINYPCHCATLPLCHSATPPLRHSATPPHRSATTVPSWLSATLAPSQAGFWKSFSKSAIFRLKYDVTSELYNRVHKTSYQKPRRNYYTQVLSAGTEVIASTTKEGLLCGGHHRLKLTSPPSTCTFCPLH